MNIVVTVKQVPDPNVAPQFDGDRLKRQGVAGVLDPGDEFGVEAALQLAAAHGGVVTVTAGVNEPRYPSFKGIVEAKKKPVETLSVGDLGRQLESSASQSIGQI